MLNGRKKRLHFLKKKNEQNKVAYRTNNNSERVKRRMGENEEQRKIM